jgi:hypothetical protein
LRIWDGVSVRRIREAGLGSDLDILEEGDWRDIILLAGAEWGG